MSAKQWLEYIRRAPRKSFVGAVVGAAIVLQLLRAIPSAASRLFTPFWQITYAHGYVRRGLLGTVFQFFVDGFPQNEQEAQILVVHSLAFAALIGGIILETVRLARGANPRTRLWLFTGSATFLLSRFVLTVAHCGGYQDVLLILLAFIASRFLDRDRLGPALAIAIIAPFLHEAFLFLWAPAAIVALSRTTGAVAKRLQFSALLALPVVAAILAVKLHSESALRVTMASLPIADGDRAAIEHNSYGLSIADAFEATTRGYREYPFNAVLGALWVLPYSFGIAACAARIARVESRRRAAVTALLATLAPLPILLIAWDFSRFLVWTTFGALLALFAGARADAELVAPVGEDGAERKRHSAAPSRQEVIAASAWLLIISLLSTGPHVYLYLNGAFAQWPFGPQALTKTPAAFVGASFVDFYNRDRPSTYHLSNNECHPDYDPARVKRVGDECAFAVDSPGVLESPVLYLPSGQYEAKVTIAADPRCAVTRIRISAWAFWRFGGERGALTVTAPGDATLSFKLDAQDAALGLIRVRVQGEVGCFRLDRLDIVRR